MSYDINIDRSTDFTLVFTVKNASGVAVDLTGATVSAEMRESAEATDSVEFEATHNNSGGTITLSLSHEDTDDISWKYGVYDVYVTYSGGTVEKILDGNVTIYSNVTRPSEGTPMRVISFNSFDSFPTAGRSNRLYLAIDENKLYRWSGTAYVALNVYSSSDSDGDDDDDDSGTTGSTSYTNPLLG